MSSGAASVFVRGSFFVNRGVRSNSQRMYENGAKTSSFDRRRDTQVVGRRSVVRTGKISETCILRTVVGWLGRTPYGVLVHWSRYYASKNGPHTFYIYVYITVGVAALHEQTWHIITRMYSAFDPIYPIAFTYFSNTLSYLGAPLRYFAECVFPRRNIL